MVFTFSFIIPMSAELIDSLETLKTNLEMLVQALQPPKSLPSKEPKKRSLGPGAGASEPTAAVRTAADLLVNRTDFFKYIMGEDEQSFKTNTFGKVNDPFSYDEKKELGKLTIVSGKTYTCGNFEALSLQELDTKILTLLYPSPAGTFSVIVREDGPTEYVDIMKLQAAAENSTAVFQISSKTNALELYAFNSKIEAGVTQFASDGAKAQSNQAVVSAAPGVIQRMYYMPERPGTAERLKKTWRQTNERQLNLLENIPDLKSINGHIVLDSSSPSAIDYTEVKVGIQSNTQVTFESSQEFGKILPLIDPEQLIHQIFVTPLNCNQDGGNEISKENIAKALLKAAYLGTIKAAAYLHHKKKIASNKVFISLVGLGSFGFANKPAWFKEVITEIMPKIKAYSLDVRLIIFDKSQVDLEDKDFISDMKKHVMNTGGTYTLHNASNPEGIKEFAAKSKTFAKTTIPLSTSIPTKTPLEIKIPVKAATPAPAKAPVAITSLETKEPREGAPTPSKGSFFTQVMGIDEEKFKGFYDSSPEFIPQFITKRGRDFYIKQHTITADEKLVATGKEFRAGYFEQLSIKELRENTAQSPKPGNGTFNLIIRNPSVTNDKCVDVAAMQADEKYRDAVFQVASQFNAYEATDRYSPMKGVTRFKDDPTQGPAAAISGAPGTILRVYYPFYDEKTAPATWRQTDTKQVEFLDMLRDKIAVTHGYTDFDKTRTINPDLSFTEEDYLKIKIGFHHNVQVVRGHNNKIPINDPEQIINQVYTAAVALGQYASARDSDDPKIQAIAQKILDAAYEGVVRSAILFGKKTVVLTLIGGGAFRNKFTWIMGAIEKMIPVIQEAVLNVYLSVYDPAGEISPVVPYNALKFIENTNGVLILHKSDTEVENIKPGTERFKKVCEKEAKRYEAYTKEIGAPSA